MIIIAIIMTGMIQANASNLDSTPNFSMLIKDYKFTDQNIQPISAGIISWTDKTRDLEPGIYAHINCLNWKRKIRFNIGAIAIIDDVVRVNAETSITMVFSIYDHKFEVGGYYAPFWGLDKRSNDPYGIMLGYIF